MKNFFSKPIALWGVIIIVSLGFAGGVLAGNHGFFDYTGKDEKIVIKGVSDQDYDRLASISTSTSTIVGSVSSTNDLPAYLRKDVNFKLYWDTWNILKDKYYDKNIADTKLFYGSLMGMVASLSDPYSVFMTPTDADQFQQDLSGSFEGIGAEIAVKNSQLLIVSPLDDSPAMKAGLKPRDWIIKINGTSTEGMNANQAVNLIRGKAGSKVILTVYREGWKEPKDFEIIRGKIVVKSVSWSYESAGTIAVIKVRQFNDDTLPLFNNAIKEILVKPQIKGIVLDLRNNPGGYLEVAVQMAGEWDGDKSVVFEKNRNGDQTNHPAYIIPRLTGYKTVVLIDGGSASASEIVAGALQDWGSAKLVGEKSFGKGSVQNLNDLPDGSQIKLTIAKWFTPSGRSIDEQGIEPDFKVALTEEDFNKDRDPQLVKALELLK